MLFFRQVLDPAINPERRLFIRFPPEEEVRKQAFHLVADVNIWDMHGSLYCAQEIVIEVGPNTMPSHVSEKYFDQCT